MDLGSLGLNTDLFALFGGSPDDGSDSASASIPNKGVDKLDFGENFCSPSDGMDFTDSDATASTAVDFLDPLDKSLDVFLEDNSLLSSDSPDPNLPLEEILSPVAEFSHSVPMTVNAEDTLSLPSSGSSRESSPPMSVVPDLIVPAEESPIKKPVKISSPYINVSYQNQTVPQSGRGNAVRHAKPDNSGPAAKRSRKDSSPSNSKSSGAGCSTKNSSQLSNTNNSSTGAAGSAVDPMMDIKRQRRMAKNRESASLSRKRKKEYVETLEHSIAELIGDKEQLTKRVSELEQENLKLREQLGKQDPQKLLKMNNGLPKSSTMLCAALLCFGFVALQQSPSAGMTNRYSNVLNRMNPRSFHSLHQDSVMPSFGRSLKSVQASDALFSAVPSQLKSGAKPRRSAPEFTSVSVGDNLGSQSLLEHSRRLARLNDTDPGRVVSTSTELVLGGSASSNNGDMKHMGTDDGADVFTPPLLRLRSDGARDYLFGSIPRRADTSYVYCMETQMVAAETLSDDGVMRMAMVIPTLPADSPTDDTASQSAAGNRRTNSQSANSTRDADASFSVLQIDCNVKGSKIVRVAMNTSVPAASP
eukprot:m.421932 g.421932  ORF g.421932 m.421932 type:complete len:587 (+) comp21321_c0_seq1:153-1913(+)